MRSSDWWSKYATNTEFKMPPTVQVPVHPLLWGIVVGFILGVLLV